MGVCPDPQTSGIPGQRQQTPEFSQALPPRLVGNAQRGSKYSARGPAVAGGAMRSLSPALQVMQRSMLNPSPDSLQVPNAPRGERPREYLNALTGAAAFLEFTEPASPRCAPKADMLMRSCSEVLPPRASSPRAPVSARRRRPASPSGQSNEALPRACSPRPLENVRTSRCTPIPVDVVLPRVMSPLPPAAVPVSARRRPSSPLDGVARPGSARGKRCESAHERQATPTINEDFKPKQPTSARIRRASVDIATDSLPMVQSARDSRPRPSSARPLGACDDNVDVCSLWPAERRRPMKTEGIVEEPVQHKSRVQIETGSLWQADHKRILSKGNVGDKVLFSSVPRQDVQTAVPTPQRDASDDAMDALDGLLASLDEERTKQPETVLTPPSSPPKAIVASHLHRCGIAPVSNKSKLAKTGKLSLPTPMYTYDDEVVVDSPSSFEVDGSPGVYCPLSPTIMSVHLPGSPIPKSTELDDTTSSVVFVSDAQKSEKYAVRPCKVRFEIRTDMVEAHKHAPQAPKRFGTGKLVSRPRGCTLVQANFGGA